MKKLQVHLALLRLYSWTLPCLVVLHLMRWSNRALDALRTHGWRHTWLYGLLWDVGGAIFRIGTPMRIHLERLREEHRRAYVKAYPRTR